ncbi:hypothetical protein NXX77_18730 [Phocaeicola dorei]|nr:hypothetical protein [Phocaeicola dorei]
MKDLQFEWHLQKVDEKNYLFSCELEVGEAPEVVVRYVTRENPEKVSL